MGPPFMMRMIFALMDADGDGTIRLQEFLGSHARISSRWTKIKMAHFPWMKCKRSSTASGDRLCGGLMSKQNGQHECALVPINIPNWLLKVADVVACILGGDQEKILRT